MIYDAQSLGLVVFMELIVLGMAKKYPFTGARMTLFFTPFVIYFIIKGIGSLKGVKVLYLSLTIFYVLFLIICSLNSFITYLKFY